MIIKLFRGKKTILLFLFSASFFIFSIQPIFGAEFFFDSEVKSARPGTYFLVDLFLDAQNQDINFVEGKIIIPAELELKEILDGDSIVALWVKKPSLENEKVFFGGSIPGGFKGVLDPFHKGLRPGKILSLILKAKEDVKEGVLGIIKIEDQRVLLNDGLGTEIKSLVNPFKIIISQTAPLVAGLLPIKDSTVPEFFEPLIAKDPNVFGGKWFLSFTAQDKESGIDHYEVLESKNRETKNKKWEKAESPYLLKDQKLRSYIFVKAIDKAGNERVVELQPKNPVPLYGLYGEYIFWIIIILAVLILYYYIYINRALLKKNLEYRFRK